LFFAESLGLAKSDAFPVVFDEFDAGGFQRSAQRGLVSERYRDFPINDLRSTDSCYANL